MKPMKNKRQLLFRAGALVILLAIAAAMFVIGRNHTVYFDNKTAKYNGQTVDPFYRVVVNVGDERAAKLSARDRGMKDVMGQKLSMTLEITDEKGAQPHAHRVSMSLPYGMDGVILNLPALMAGLPEDAYLSEFIAAVPEEDEDEEPAGDSEFSEFIANTPEGEGEGPAEDSETGGIDMGGF